MSVRFSYQNLAEPLSVDPEAVHSDAWSRDQETHHPKLRLRNEFYAIGMDLGTTILPPELAWRPEFPDFARGFPPIKPQPGAFQPEERVYTDVLHWQGSAPDYLPRVKPRLQGAFSETINDEIDVMPAALSWQGQLPEFARGHAPRPEGIALAITEPTLYVTPDPLSWRGEQPDFARGHKPREAGLWCGVIEASLISEPAFDSWFNQRPEQAPGHKPRPHGDRTAITEPTMLGDVVPSVDGWRGEWPDYARAHKPRPAGDINHIGPESLQSFVQVDQWHGEQPDFARGRGPVAPQPGVSVIEASITPELSAWAGYQPDIAWGAKPRPVTDYAAPVESSLMFVVDMSTWQGVEPVVMRPRVNLAYLQAAGVLSTLAANSGVDSGPFEVVQFTIFVPGDASREIWVAGDASREVFVAGDSRRVIRGING